MFTLLKRLLPLALALAVFAAPLAEAAAPSEGPLAGNASKKKKAKKKCKAKKKKAKKRGKKAKCKKQKSAAGPTGLPGKPVNPNPTDPPDAAPAQLQALTLEENPLLGGTSGEGLVTIKAPAPAGGAPVTLGSDTPSRAGVPDSVHIAAGQTSVSFPITTTAGAPTSAILTAAAGTSVRSATLDIVDKATLERVTLDYQCFPGVADGYASNSVSLNVRAPADPPVVVALASSDPFTLEVPDDVTVPEGSFNGAFTVNALLASPSVTVTASYDGIDRIDTALIRDSSSPVPEPNGLSASPNSVVVGDPSTGTVSLDCEAPAGGINVSLATSYGGVTLPASVIVPEGQLSATFPISTVVTATPGDAQITATAGASVQTTLNLRALGT